MWWQLNWSKEKESSKRSISEFYWIYLSILANAHLPPVFSGHEDAWRRDTVHSCSKQCHTPFRGPMHRSGGLQAASGQEVCVSLLLNTFLHWDFRGRSMNYNTNHRKASCRQGILYSHCVSYFCATLSRGLKCNIGLLIDSQVGARKWQSLYQGLNCHIGPNLWKNESPIGWWIQRSSSSYSSYGSP